MRTEAEVKRAVKIFERFLLESVRRGDLSDSMTTVFGVLRWVMGDDISDFGGMIDYMEQQDELADAEQKAASN